MELRARSQGDFAADIPDVLDGAEDAEERSRREAARKANEKGERLPKISYFRHVES